MREACSGEVGAIPSPCPLLRRQMGKHTTPMYRAPEMLDTWNNHAITCQADIWALGCVLYLLCFNRHPFEDSAKLRIINGNYTIPEGDTKYQHFHQLIREWLSEKHQTDCCLRVWCYLASSLIFAEIGISFVEKRSVCS